MPDTRLSPQSPSPIDALTAARPRYREANLSRSEISWATQADGTMRMRALDPPLDSDELGFSSFVPRWAETRGTETAFGERDGPNSWRTINWLDFHEQMISVAAGLIEMGLSSSRPLMILSGNSIEQALLVMAAEYVGIPTAPVSPGYSLLSRSYERLLEVYELVEPAAVFVQSASRFEGALQALGTSAGAVIAVDNVQSGQVDWQTLAHRTLSAAERLGVTKARSAIRRDRDIARIFLTSGSTGTPKGVPLTYDVISRVIAHIQYTHRGMPSESICMVDWLPWSHTFAGIGNLGRFMTLGGSYYIDDGRPLPGQFSRTVQNLNEFAPSMYATVPAAWAMIAAELESDERFARTFFSRLKYVSYGGASLSRDVWERFQAVARRVAGEQIIFTSGYGSTETAASGVTFNRPVDDVGNIGLPNPGVELKLMPMEGGDGRYEVRMRGRNVFAGYLKRQDLTRAAFDEEGFYCLGDAVRLIDPRAPEKGLQYAGRCVEDFKLDTGTWVRVGSVRLGLVDQCAPLITDAVICGHDGPYVAALAWPNVAACRRLACELEDLSVEALVSHPIVLSELQNRLSKQAHLAPSQRVARLLLMPEPPSSDQGEIADKGYINQAKTRQRRSPWVDRLLAEQPEQAVVGIPTT